MKLCPIPPNARAEYFYRDPVFVKRRLLAAAASAYLHNKRELLLKAWWTSAALMAMLIEGLFLAAATIIQIFI